MKQTSAKTDLSPISPIIEKYGTEKKSLISILHAVSSEYNYLPKEALHYIAEKTGINIGHIISVASFYPQFRFTPAGAHRIKVCVGTACHVKGAETVFLAIKDFLGINAEEDTDSSRTFTVEKVACLGCCMLAPAVQIDETTYGFLSRDRVPSMIQSFLESKDIQTKINKNGRLLLTALTAEIRMCTCSSCDAAGAGDVFRAFQKELSARNIPATLKNTGCTGISFEAPLVEIKKEKDTLTFGRVTVEDVPGIVAELTDKKSIREKLVSFGNTFVDRVLFQTERLPSDIALNMSSGKTARYWNMQTPIVTRNAHSVSPLDIQAYRNQDGFTALEKCRALKKKDSIIKTLVESGLRGRGGGGYPTGKKWQEVFKAAAFPKYIVCNGDEGDPGAFMDRMILESVPFRVIEGILIAMTAIGACQAYLYVRMEYPLALSRLHKALEIVEKAGLLSHQNEKLKINIIEGGGAFVCGEETALLASIEGRRGMPSLRPPFPSETGLFGKPTLVNNVETFALVPWIIRHGETAFRNIGTKKSPGTKTFALAGKINHGGLVEVPMGISLHDIIYKIGGGIQHNKKLKAVQIGGPSGGCIPASLSHLPVDYEALTKNHAIMGSGGLIILDETDCMVEIARYFMEFTQGESCGKCTPCRVGTLRMKEILTSFTLGEGTHALLEELIHLADIVAKTSLCGLGKTAPNPVLSVLRHFQDEFIAHINGKCPAKACKQLIEYTITEKCIGCTRCSQYCPVDAIPFNPYKQQMIAAEKCIRCDTCRQVCPSNAIKIVDRECRHD